MNKLTRRDCLLLGLTGLITGCTQPRRVETPTSSRPMPHDDFWRSDAPSKAPEPPPKASSPNVSGLISRDSWTRDTVRTNLTVPMNGVWRITVHHEGAPVRRDATGWADTVGILRGIRRYHVEERGWADMGYHYVIDRAGRIWEARPSQFQGAHVRKYNGHNLGVMVLGNFDLQEPTNAQLETLAPLVRELRQTHYVPLENVRTHQEWVATACPGKHLQPRCEAMKNSGDWT